MAVTGNVVFNRPIQNGNHNNFEQFSVDGSPSGHVDNEKITLLRKVIPRFEL